jgi:hypothetical protein
MRMLENDSRTTALVRADSEMKRRVTNSALVRSAIATGTGRALGRAPKRIALPFATTKPRTMGSTCAESLSA